jgi:ABC-2 type transport system permease protein
MSVFCLFNNLIYKLDYDNDGNYKYDDEINLKKEIKNQEKELSRYNIQNDNDKNMYITIKSKLDILKIQQKYNKNSWQYIKANDYLYDALYNLNYYKYIDKDIYLIEKYTKIYQEKKFYLDTDNWKYFIRLEKNNLLEKQTTIKNKLNSSTDKKLKKELEEELKKLDKELLIINYRINNNINYGNNYLNRALNEYSKAVEELEIYKNKIISYQDKIAYQKNIETKNINKYIIENKVNLNKPNNLNYQLKSIVEDYELFIVIIILITTSILIGEEFNKGTIKLLLIKPYKRSTILLSKFLAAVLILLLTILFLILIEFIIGGLIFGIDSLKIGMIIYNFNLNKIENFNIYLYMLIRITTKLPSLLMILIISFLLGIIFNNTIVPFSVTILIYTFSEVINNLIINYNIKFMQYLITINWNFKDYLFGRLSNYEYINFKKSILIYIIYVIIFMNLMFQNFKKKNIKNI